MVKAAIVIGVNHTGSLPRLRAGVSGAQQFGAWLAGEGFDVHLFVDEQRPVTLASIAEEIIALVGQGTVEQLVVYFSGHGFLHNYSEYWLLSGAPRNPNEAISVRESVDLARESGIPSVVLVSDACRSTPQSLQAERVQGGLIFPNDPVSRNVRPEVDRFFASLPGDPAIEMAVGESLKQHKGIFTHCFLQAYTAPEPLMVQRITLNRTAVYVVPNRRLKAYLRREVPKIMRRRKILIGQLPDAVVESDDTVYIGRVASGGPPGPIQPESIPVSQPISDDLPTGPTVEEPDTLLTSSRGSRLRGMFDVSDVAQVAVARAMEAPIYLPEALSNEIGMLSGRSGFDASVRLVSDAQRTGAEHFETMTGFKVVGTRVSDAIGLNMHAMLLNGGGMGEPANIRLDPGYSPIMPAQGVSSVVIRFGDGAGTVLAAFRGYIGTVVVENGRVVNVSYAPSDNSPLWPYYLGERLRLEQLRAVVATAARYGVFRVDRENAGRVADRIRFLKSVDPTLGLYAAYAYAEVGISDEVRSVMDYMQNDLSANLFDVAMLAGQLTRSPLGGRLGSRPVVPFCPMLSQGWTLLRVKRAAVPPPVEEASAHLLPALWTTFDSPGMDIILRAITDRRLS